MSRPLIDIDANSRQPGVMSSRLAARKHSPAAPLSAKSELRANPFRISASGSPRYMTPRSSPMAGLSLSVGSKIPRKADNTRRSQVGAASASARVSQSKQNQDQKVALKHTSGKQKPAHSPPSNRDKPLPSPPIARVVDPSSPPKAQRTLIDAEVAGTPTSEEWPILSPENMLSRQSLSPSASSPFNFNVDKPEDSPQQSHDNPSSNDEEASATEALDSCHRRTMSASPEFSTKHASFDGSPISMSALDSPTEGLHAITAPHDDALEESPTSRFSIPPRLSSKRTSLPIANKKKQSSLQQKRQASTKWPLLGTKDYNGSPSASVPLISKRDAEETTQDLGLAATHHDAIGDTQHEAPRAITDDDTEQNTRVKRLSGHSVNSGLGPILKIADEANSVLLGERQPSPPWPIVSDEEMDKATKEQSLGAMAGRISRQTISRMSLTRGSRSSTPQPEEKPKKVSSVKIFPIRKMQPPRNASSGTQPRSVSSPHPQSSRSAVKDVKSSLTSSGGKRSGSTAEVAAQPAQQNTRRGSRQFKDSVIELKDGHKRHSTTETWPLKDIPTKAVNVLGITPNDTGAPAQKRTAIPWNSPKGSLSKAQIKAAPGSKADSPLIRSAHRNSRHMATKNGSLGSTPSSEARIAHVHDEASPVSTKTKETRSATAGSSSTTPELRGSFVSAAKEDPVQSKSDTFPLSPKVTNDDVSKRNKVGNDTNEKAAKVKTKRSFRDFFHIRDGKRTVDARNTTENKRASLTFSGNTLAKRFRTSANLSKPSLYTASVASMTPRPGSQATARKDVEGGRDSISTDALNTVPATCSDTGVIVTKIVNSVSSLPSHSPDRLRGLEIAETLLNAADAYKQARISATKAQKHARQAELNAGRAGVEMERMQKLCEPNFSPETMQAIKQLVQSVGAVGRDEQSSQ